MTSHPLNTSFFTTFLPSAICNLLKSLHVEAKAHKSRWGRSFRTLNQSSSGRSVHLAYLCISSCSHRKPIATSLSQASPAFDARNARNSRRMSERYPSTSPPPRRLSASLMYP